MGRSDDCAGATARGLTGGKESRREGERGKGSKRGKEQLLSCLSHVITPWVMFIPNLCMHIHNPSCT
jgi:hypothetical protein